MTSAGEKSVVDPDRKPSDLKDEKHKAKVRFYAYIYIILAKRRKT
jgi:hypothetical protein